MEKLITQNVGRRLGDLDDLPEELKSQLVSAKRDDLEVKIVDTISKLDGLASVDEVIVHLYRDHGFIGDDRRVVGNKLYKMTKDGILKSIPGKKGVYEVISHDSDVES